MSFDYKKYMAEGGVEQKVHEARGGVVGTAKESVFKALIPMIKNDINPEVDALAKKLTAWYEKNQKPVQDKVGSPGAAEWAAAVGELFFNKFNN